MMKRIVLVVVAAGVVAVWPAASGAATFGGVVVAKQRTTLLVASPAGVVRAVAGHAALGARVVVAGGRARVVGRAHVARVRGIVIRRLASTLFLSSNHHLVALRAAPGSARERPGEIVTTRVSIENGAVEEEEAEDLGDTPAAQVQALVTAVAPGSITLSVNGQSLTIRLPAGLTLPASLVGQMVTIRVRFDDAADDDDAAAPSAAAPGVVVVGAGQGDREGDDRGGGGGGGGHGGDDGGGHH
jgi:hypothetical protein